MARLRRDLDGTAPTWMSIGEELFAQWPQELEAPADDSPEFDRQVNAVKVALELYAVHQQSKGQGVAQKYQTDPSSRMTFGRACRRITPDPEQAKGVLRRLRVVESASDFNGVVRGVRTLIMLMRGADVQIDYGSLARDLYLIQLPSQRGKVFQSWGRDYYYSKQSSNNNDVFEKMTAWRSSVTQQKKLGLPAPPHMPVVHDAGKALWRGLEPILCASDEGDSRPGLIRWLEEIRTEILESEKHVLDLVTIHAQGMTYGTQSSVFETGIDDTLSLNSVMFRHDYSGIASVLDVVKCTDGAVLALSQFVRNLRAASGDKGKSTETAEQVREWAYADLDGLFRDELAAFDETQDPIEYANAWKDEIHRRLLQMGWE